MRFRCWIPIRAGSSGCASSRSPRPALARPDLTSVDQTEPGARAPSPWPGRLILLAAGLAAGLAHTPFGFLPGIAGYGLMMLAAGETDGRGALRSSFFRGWLAGVGYFAVSTWWITEPFQVDAAQQGWMAPFALLLMAGGLALFWGIAALLFRLSKVTGALGVLVFAGALALMEWARGHVFTGFPWNLPGETWRAGSALSQAAALVGPYGLSWITIAVGASAALIIDNCSRRERIIGLASAALVLAALFGYGAARLATAPATAPDALSIRVVQANIDQKDKWRPENLDQIVQAYLRLSRSPQGGPQVVVWPEGALPAVIDDLLAPGSPYVDQISGALRPGQTLLLGANRAGRSPGGGVDYFNSLIALRREPAGLKVTGVYDKHRLVPFGEFLPFGDLATRWGIRSLVHMPEDFTAGPEPVPLAPEGLPAFQPMICYEALFPRFAERAAQRSGARPKWLVNVSNDAWFGATSGPLQHLNIASYRAIENGLPIVRATPTGVSAIIDAQGQIVPRARLNLGVEGVIDARLPTARGPTVYNFIGETGFATMLLLSAAIVVLGRLPPAVRS